MGAMHVNSRERSTLGSKDLCHARLAMKGLKISSIKERSGSIEPWGKTLIDHPTPHTHVHALTQTHGQTHRQTHIHAVVMTDHTHRHTYKHKYSHACTHIHTYTFTHT
jgi:hypothetical protein